MNPWGTKMRRFERGVKSQVPAALRWYSPMPAAWRGLAARSCSCHPRCVGTSLPKGLPQRSLGSPSHRQRNRCGFSTGPADIGLADLLRAGWLVCRSMEDWFNLVFIYSKTGSLHFPARARLSDYSFCGDFPLFLYYLADLLVRTTPDHLHFYSTLLPSLVLKGANDGLFDFSSAIAPPAGNSSFDGLDLTGGLHLIAPGDASAWSQRAHRSPPYPARNVATFLRDAGRLAPPSRHDSRATT